VLSEILTILNGFVVAVNVAVGKTATQISRFLTEASAAVDGDLTTSSCTSNTLGYPWFAVDLGLSYYISSITIAAPHTSTSSYRNCRPSCRLFINFIAV